MTQIFDIPCPMINLGHFQRAKILYIFCIIVVFREINEMEMHGIHIMESVDRHLFSQNYNNKKKLREEEIERKNHFQFGDS